MSIGGDLSVRSHERVSCALAAEAWIDEQCQGQVRLSGTAGNPRGAVGTTVVDCSLGGLGLSSPVFFPKGCRLRVKIASPDGNPATPTTVEAMVVLQRVAMLDRSPRYYLGGAFEEDGGEGARALLDLVRRAQRGEAAARA